jgi:hypothetical protein
VQEAADVTLWDAQLLEAQAETSLVTIGRQRRLVLDDGRGPRHVDLCWVDEVALALIDLAVARERSIDLVYPAPAGQVAVLLAAEILLGQFVRGVRAPSLGIVTADTTMAARTWNAISIANPGARASLSDVYPCFRAGPEGESPFGRRRFKGILIGQRCARWPVDLLVVDHLAGPVQVDAEQPSIAVFANPLDRSLREPGDDGRLVWGWSDSDVAEFHEVLEVRPSHTVPFSVAADRLEAIAHGVAVTVTVARHDEAEAALARVREDLRLLRAMSPQRSDRHFERGMSVAWHHLSTLTSLPCAPQRFDRFAGLPPWAARATRTFGQELSAWASTLKGDVGEIATILASDIGDLRAALDQGNPFETTLKEATNGDVETLVVTRTRTASRALLDSLGSNPDATGVACLTVCPIGRLHREGNWQRALVIGEPSPWDWHRLLSGLSTDLEVLALGNEAARGCASMISAERTARDHWGGDEVRGYTWQALLASKPPPSLAAAHTARPVVVVDGVEFVPESDPFDSFASLFELDPLDFGGEGPADGLARETDEGAWAAAVPAIEIFTDHGRVLLEAGRAVEVRVGQKIVDRRPEQLQRDDVLLIGRRQGRVGLLEALEERLADRPDLLAARLLIDRYHQSVRTRFAESGLSFADLHRKLAALGCDKTIFAARSWVTEGGIMAPRDFSDLQRLNISLEIGMSDRRLTELFAFVQRRRVFRRAAGRALAEAARSATVVDDHFRVDSDTGLSLADLRDAVIEAVVLSVSPCDEPVPLTLLGRLETS